MPNSKQAKKRLRQDEKRRDRNKSRKSAMATEIKKIDAAIESGNISDARVQLGAAMQKIDRAAKAGVIHANNAARKKSLLARKIQALESSKGSS